MTCSAAVAPPHLCIRDALLEFIGSSFPVWQRPEVDYLPLGASTDGLMSRQPG